MLRRPRLRRRPQGLAVGAFVVDNRRTRIYEREVVGNAAAALDDGGANCLLITILLVAVLTGPGNLDGGCVGIVTEHRLVDGIALRRSVTELTKAAAARVLDEDIERERVAGEHPR